jgi:hypothetical protein
MIFVLNFSRITWQADTILSLYIWVRLFSMAREWALMYFFLLYYHPHRYRGSLFLDVVWRLNDVIDIWTHVTPHSKMLTDFSCSPILTDERIYGIYLYRNKCLCQDALRRCVPNFHDTDGDDNTKERSTLIIFELTILMLTFCKNVFLKDI